MRSFSKIFITLCFLAIAVSCNKEEPSDNLAKLEYFECKIDGEPFEAVSDFTCSGPRWDYYPEPYLNLDVGFALISGRDCRSDAMLAIRMSGLEHQTGHMNFLEPSYADTVYPIYMFIDESISDFVIFEKLISGSLKIDKFEARQNGSSPLGWIEGSFEFMLTNELDSDTIRVTNGRFGFDVPQIF